jgi:nucleotide sugar dehydrogenase
MVQGTGGEPVKIAVVGAGKMGLPLACRFADCGATVLACDRNPLLVATINDGVSPIDEPGLDELVHRLVASGRLTATTETAAAVAASEVVVVIVPAVLTPDNEIDTSMLISASREVAKGLSPGMMVSYETTVPVGGTRRLLAPVLAEGGLRPGEDFDVVFSPERVKSQSVLRNLTVNPKVVGGMTPASADRATAFYQKYLGAPVMNVGTLEAAEMVKLAGMAYRDVNIALANELSRYADVVGVDLPALLPAINCDGEAAVLQPGIGVGGHCTPVYPYFLIRDAERRGVNLELVQGGRRINDGQVPHLLDQFEAEWKTLAGKRVLILGLGFRPGVKEHHASTAFILRDDLQRRGAMGFLHDPLYDEEEVRSHGFVPGAPDQPGFDVVVLNTSHPEYGDLPFAGMARQGLEAVLDGRNFWDPDVVRGFGLHYMGVGRPAPGSYADDASREGWDATCNHC